MAEVPGRPSHDRRRPRHLAPSPAPVWRIARSSISGWASRRPRPTPKGQALWTPLIFPFAQDWPASLREQSRLALPQGRSLVSFLRCGLAHSRPNHPPGTATPPLRNVPSEPAKLARIPLDKGGQCSRCRFHCPWSYCAVVQVVFAPRRRFVHRPHWLAFQRGLFGSPLKTTPRAAR